MFGEETGFESARKMERLGSMTGDARKGRGWVTMSHCGVNGKRRAQGNITARKVKTTAKLAQTLIKEC